MAYIEVREKADGTLAYKAEVVVTLNGKRVKRTATFDRRVTANRWAKKTEKELRMPGGLERLSQPKKPVTVAEAINRYMTSSRTQFKSTKQQVLSFVRDGRCNFSDVLLRDLRANHVRAFAEELADGHRGPATVSSYLTHICHVLSVAEDDFGPAYAVSLDALSRGKSSARRNGLAGKPNVRERRPTLKELDMLMAYFINRQRTDPRANPMAILVAFAIFEIRRQSEITKLKWADLDGQDILVRAMKDPRRPAGRDKNTLLTDEALRVIELHGRQDQTRIFPYSPGVISRTFTNACKTLGIDDLRFHDLRHEGVSWLREKGWETSHVMMVSGHSATSTLDRYTNLKMRGDKYENWRWWEPLEEMAALKSKT